MIQMTQSTRNKVPGPMHAHKESYVENLATYTIVQLIEIRNRQAKLLENKSRMAKLPDRGERITSFHNRILNEISKRNEIDEAAARFSDLNIAAKGIKAVTAMEWSAGKSTQPPSAETAVDSDDDDYADPLKILAQARELKTVKLVKAEESLITPSDLADIASFAEDTSGQGERVSLEPHAIYMCEKDAKNTIIKPKFKPYNTTTSNAHDIDKEKARKLGPHWEVTAATPPILRNSGMTVLTLQESIDIQRQQYKKLKAIQEKQVRERLEARQKIVAGNLDLLPSGSDVKDVSKYFNTYRTKQKVDSDSDNDEYCDTEEYYNDGDDDEGGVVIPIYD